MVPSIIVAILVVTAVLIGGGILLAMKADKARGEALTGLANDMGLTYAKDGKAEVSRVSQRFKLFTHGRRPDSKHLVFGQSSGTGVWIFDYLYTTGSGKHQTRHKQTVLAFQSDALNIPQFTMHKEGMFSRVGAKVFGAQDIDFDSHPAFSDRWVLKGESEDAIRDSFTADVLDALEVLDNKINLEGNGDMLLFYRANKKVKVDDVRGLLQEGFGVFRVFAN